jgi:hypothetical protein
MMHSCFLAAACTETISPRAPGSINLIVGGTGGRTTLARFRPRKEPVCGRYKGW